MSKTNSEVIETETKIEPVSEVVETVKEPVKETVSAVTEKVIKPDTTVAKMSAETQRMNARQFFDTYPHDNTQVVNLIITLYGSQIKTVAQWEAFYQSMLKKKVS